MMKYFIMKHSLQLEDKDKVTGASKHWEKMRKTT